MTEGLFHMWLDRPEPGNATAETVADGKDDMPKGVFHMSLHGPEPGSDTVIDFGYLDVQEHFLVYAYRDLLDFITDFQKTRSGKPTKPILKEIQNWDPTFDLQQATKEQRIKWRRAYTINWLYDLVNVFSSAVVQCRTLLGRDIALETVD